MSKSNWDYEQLVLNQKVSDELLCEIKFYIQNNQHTKKIKGYEKINNLYINNLQYILDNINNPNLLKELQDINESKRKN